MVTRTAQGPAALQRLSHDKFSVSGDNRGEAAETAIVTASASNGISASVSFSRSPKAAAGGFRHNNGSQERSDIAMGGEIGAPRAGPV